MAINLKKENTNDGEFYPKAVYPDNYTAEEIYPQQKAVSYAEPDIMPVPEQVVSPSRGVYPAAPANNGVTVPDPRKKKKWLVPVVVLCTAMVVSSVLTVAMIIGGINEHTSYDYEAADYGMKSSVFSVSDVKGIVIEDSNSYIYITSSYDRNITVETSDSSFSQYEVTVENNIVTVSSAGGDSDENAGGAVTLYIPSAYRGPITINAKGETDIDCYAGKSFDISSDSGTVNFSGVNGASAKVALNYGNVYMSNCELESCDLHTYSGYMSMYCSSFTDKCSVYTDNGGVSVDSTVFFGGAEIYSSGYVDITDTSFSGDSYVTAFNGSINAEQVDFENLHIKNQNGDLTVYTEKGAENYTVTAKTTNSDIFFEPQINSANNGKYVLDVDLLNSDAEIHFGQ